MSSSSQVLGIKKQNNDYFSREVDSYKSSYLRDCEIYLTRYLKGKVLVMGCGAGRVLEPLKDLGFDVVGLDLNSEMVLEAKKNHPGIQIYNEDACATHFESGTFDSVFFPFHGIDYVYPDIYEAVREVRRILKPEGVFIMSSHNRFYFKKLNQFFKGNYTDHNGLMTYRTTPLDKWKLKKYFKKVKIIQRISISKTSNWKDRVYKAFPFFNKSTYFVCE